MEGAPHGGPKRHLLQLGHRIENDGRMSMIRAEVHFRGGSVMEVEAEDFETYQHGPAHKISATHFFRSESAKQYVIHFEMDEVVAIKITDLDAES